MTSYWNQYLVLQGRAVAAYTRNPANVAGRTVMAIFVAVFAGMIFMRPPAGIISLSRMICLFLSAKPALILGISGGPTYLLESWQVRLIV